MNDYEAWSPEFTDGAPASSSRSHTAQNAATGKPTKILVVEDEAKTAAFLSKGLTESGFTVEVAENGANALQLTTACAYDLIILDVMLPDLDGWSVLTEIRRQRHQTRVLFLTACDALEDRVMGLQLGADDYLVKPFSFSELLARVRTLLRRRQPRQAETLRIADLEIDMVRHRVTRAGQAIDLTLKEFALLSLLVRRASEILSPAFIAAKIWDMDFHTDRGVVAVAIQRLRSKVDGPFEKKLIRSVRGMGYVLEDR